MQRKIPCTVMRGGTSKGLFFRSEVFPGDPVLRDKVILSAFGSPDPKQIDGMGGAVSVTSKLAIIGPPTVPGADVDYTFGQVSITHPLVDYKGNCGNISSAVGPYAVDDGLVPPEEPITTVRIYNTNTKKIIVARVPVSGGKAEVEGDCRIAGVPGTGARITLDFQNPAGSVTGQLLPTGNLQDEFDLGPDGSYRVSIVDAANPLVFVKADQLGLTGAEMPRDIDSNVRASRILERIRSEACFRLGLVSDPGKATALSPAVPKVAYLAKPGDYVTAGGVKVSFLEIDFLARTMSMQRAHRSYAITGAVCTAVAACLPGTVVHEVADFRRRYRVAFGHPDGVITLECSVREKEKGEFVVERVAVERTARRIMDGYVYIPESMFRG